MPKHQSTFLCHACADRRGLLCGLHASSSNPNAYQVGKAEKHTRPSSFSAGPHSVLESGSTSDYDMLAKRAIEVGYLEVEPSGARTLSYQAASPIGRLYRDGCESALCDTFRLVLSSASSGVHGYPAVSATEAEVRCGECSVKVTS